jgi:hypothetical protein
MCHGSCQNQGLAGHHPPKWARFRDHILTVHRVAFLHVATGDTASEQCSMLPDKYDAGAIVRRNVKRAHVGFQVSQALQ